MSLYKGISQSNSSEFLDFGRWSFDPRLESKLKKFTTSTTYKYSLKTSNTIDDGQNLENESMILETKEEMHLENTNEEMRVENANEHIKCGDLSADLELASQSFLCTQDRSKLVANLREGTLSLADLDTLSDEDITSFIIGGSDDIIFNFCESLCSIPQNQDKYISLLCEKILLAKIRDPAFLCSRTLLPTIKKTIETFPAEVCSYIIVPLLSEHDVLGKLVPFLSELENGKKQIILKSLLESLKVLSELQIPLLQSLIVVITDEDTSEKLVDLLLASGSNLCKSSSFGKLLFSVTEQIGPHTSPVVKKKLWSTIDSHKSIQKGRIMKVFQSLPP